MEWWNNGIMEYWVLKTDEGLILKFNPGHHHKIRSHYAKPIIPTLQYSIIPLCSVTAQPIIDDPRQRDHKRLALRTRISMLD